MEPLCSVVVVTWNRRRELEVLLDSVFRQTMATLLEVIVIDNGSNDGTVQWLTEKYPHPVQVYAFDKNRGASYGRNAGILLSSTQFVCFLDSDAEILSPDAIEKCLWYLEKHPEIRAVTAPIWFDRECTKPFSLGAYITTDGHFDWERTANDHDDPMLISSCFAIWNRNLLFELRGFDPWYFWGIEDMDLSLRAYRAARRGKTKAATRFHVVEGVSVLHEMSSEGRLIDPHHFDQKFNFIERQRLYLVLAYGGLMEFLRVLLRGPFQMAEHEHAWRQPLGWRYRWRLVIKYPLWRLLALPKNLIDVRRNHLGRTPMPREVPRKRAVG